MDNKALNSLRSILKSNTLDGFFIPRADMWPDEFISDRSERLAWISGFTGSSGIGIVLQDKAVVLTDGRYTLQVAQQIDPAQWDHDNIRTVTPPQWVCTYAEEKSRMGYDPKLHAKSDIDRWQKELDKKGICLVPVEHNPIDDLWTDAAGRPQESGAPAYLFFDAIAGRGYEQKLDQVADILRAEKMDGFFFAMPDSVAWLLNVRGGDMAHTPVALSCGLLLRNGSFVWFIDPDKVPQEVSAHLQSRVMIRPLSDLDSYLKTIEGRIGIDEARSSCYFLNCLQQPLHRDDPTVLLKACKTEAEQEAIRQAHIHDGLALTQFHRWLHDADTKNLDEIKIEEKLEEFRRAHPSYQGPSFDTIAGAAEHGAVIHYRATPQTNKKLVKDNLLLIDSGGQYLGDGFAGTTDVTRVYAIGEPTPEQKHHYTLVLKAHIAVARAVFPYGATGAQIDALARSVLWEEGLDFEHRLGHGVGCFLNVHEEATDLSWRGTQKLEPGMLLSNEPGLYLPGQYGIRLENLMLVQKSGEKDQQGRDMLYFETVTLTPFENTLINFQDLNGKEMAWLESYYRKISEKLEI